MIAEVGVPARHPTSYPVCASKPTCLRRYRLTQQCPQGSSVVGINMVHQTHNGLPELGDFRPGSWRDVVGLLIALIGLALAVGMTVTM
jgi:hypothetical protein